MSKKQQKPRRSYQDVLDKLQTIGTSNMFWSPKPGRSTIRVLPPVKGMELFFKEVGQHRFDNKDYFCPDVCTDGKESCPACEVNSALYDAGEKDAAADFRYSRRFFMNVVVRGEEAAGPRIYTPGITVFGAISSMIQDPDYGEVYDEEEGTDIVIERTGTGLDTTYQVRPVKRANTPLCGDEDTLDNWLENAVDLEEYVTGKLLSYDDLAKATGAVHYLEGYDDDEPENDKVREPEYEEDDEYDDDESASEIIQRRMSRRRQSRGGGGKATSRRRRTS